MKLNDLEIKAFRGIRNLTLKDFQDVNLLLGDNDAGKTTVLEAIVLGGVRNNIDDIIRCSRARLSPTSAFFRSYSTLESFYFMFPFSDEPENSIELSMTFDEIRHSLRLEGQLMLTESESNDGKLEEIRTFEGTYIVDGKSQRLEMPENYRYKVPLKTSQETATLFCSSGSHLWATNRLSAYSGKGNERKIVEIMRLIDPDIEGVKLVQGAIGVHEVIEHGRFGEVPLFTYGDGLKKLLTLADAVISAENGILLIDEIETSVQASLLSEAFSWLIKACGEMNVQLFATTHSLEAISALTRCAMENSDISLAGYRLDRLEEKIKVRRFSKIALNKLVNGSGTDVR